MAYAADNRTATITLGNRFSLLVAHLQDVRAKRKVFTTTVNELSALTNAELADIGLNRSMIQSVAREAAELG